jgi:hypothetical protein
MNTDLNRRKQRKEQMEFSTTDPALWDGLSRITQKKPTNKL